MRVVVLMGPPGSGKGTVSDRLKARLGCRHISTGNLLREAIAKGSASGCQAKGCMDRGELVPDDLIVALVNEQFDGFGSGNYLLDGFPRTLAQARILDKGLTDRGACMEAVVELVVADKVLLERLGGRRLCEKCGAGFHVAFIPPKSAGVCDRCGGVLIQRPDDCEDAIVRRLDVYASQMDELRPFFRERGVFFQVDAAGTPAQTEAGILNVLGRG